MDVHETEHMAPLLGGLHCRIERLPERERSAAGVSHGPAVLYGDVAHL